MSIAYDYPAIGPLVKGDTWWTARKPEPETLETLPVPEALKPFEEKARALLGADDLFGRGPGLAAVDEAMQRLLHVVQTGPALDCPEPSLLRRMRDQRKIEEAAFLDGTVVYRTSLPPATWRRLSVE